MDRIAEVLLCIVAGNVARDIKSQLGMVVHQFIEAELGPVAAPPAAPAAQVAPPADAPKTNGEDRGPRLSIDVVGLTGHPVTEVARAFKADRGINLRFIQPEKAKNAEFRPHVIAVTKFIPHEAVTRAESHGVQITYANGAALSVIDAIRGLMESHRGQEASQVH
jgi:hypothetical protein